MNKDVSSAIVVVKVNVSGEFEQHQGILEKFCKINKSRIRK